MRTTRSVQFGTGSDVGCGRSSRDRHKEIRVYHQGLGYFRLIPACYCKGKGEVILGGGGVAAPLLTSALDGDEWSASPPEKEPPDIHCIGGWVDPKASRDVMERKKISFPCRGSKINFLSVQPIAHLLSWLGYPGSHCETSIVFPPKMWFMSWPQKWTSMLVHEGKRVW
jgi:hypothetical protein